MWLALYFYWLVPLWETWLSYNLHGEPGVGTTSVITQESLQGSANCAR